MKDKDQFVNIYIANVRTADICIGAWIEMRIKDKLQTLADGQKDFFYCSHFYDRNVVD